MVGFSLLTKQQNGVWHVWVQGQTNQLSTSQTVTTARKYQFIASPDPQGWKINEPKVVTTKIRHALRHPNLQLVWLQLLFGSPFYSVTWFTNTHSSGEGFVGMGWWVDSFISTRRPKTIWELDPEYIVCLKNSNCQFCIVNGSYAALQVWHIRQLYVC